MTGRQQADLTRMRAKFTRLQAEAERYKTENAELRATNARVERALNESIEDRAREIAQEMVDQMYPLEDAR